MVIAGAEIDVASWYERRAGDFDMIASHAHRRGELLAASRLAGFVVAVLSAAWLFSLPSRPRLAALLSAASAVAFLVLVALHRRAGIRERRARALADHNRRGASRVRRDWASLLPGHETAPSNHQYAADLDVAGTSASLYRLVDVVSVATGRPAVLRWLLDAPPAIDQLVERHTAIRELAGAIEFREQLSLLGRQGADFSHDHFDGFLRWAEDTPWFSGRVGLVWIACVLPLVTITATVLALFRWLLWTAPVLSILASLFVLARYRAPMTAIATDALRHASGLRAQRRMLEHLASATFGAPLLREEQRNAAGGAGSLRSLERALSLLEGQGSFIHALLAPILLWDIHALAWLDRWRRRHGQDVRACLEALGTVEALAALATLAHDNPGWTFPELDPSADRLTARSLAHPLLPATSRVPNDVTVGPGGTILLVTGSNMSGKSTLLRAIGLNVVLAHAGAPVCADSLTMPVLELRTSIRLADSLERGVSLFMAELERLKDIVDAARATDRQ
ncbi:MAG: hypothetical protein JOZ73_02270, partial [Solirubrobacterales bacterium]|nr:hypothetical protein [Solirubrobacterales bacterium]